MQALTDEQIQKAAEELESKGPEEVLRWAAEQFPSRIAMASSFGAEDVVLIHMVTKVKPDLEIFYLNTGFQFKETDDVKERWKRDYNINLKEYSSEVSAADFIAEHGQNIFGDAPDFCCQVRKVAPLKRALDGLDAWVTGLRREQAATRKSVKKVERDKKFYPLIKVNPLADWTSEQVWAYIKANGIPYNPLHDRGYPSIGCQPCTKPVALGEDARSGRWAGKEKTECGLHM